jgi:hypothetical protein
VRYDDKPVRGWLELLQECCGVAPDTTLNDLTSLGFAGGDRPKGIVRAREGVLLLKLGRLEQNPQVWERFGAARLRLTFEACYCSIIGECWKSDLRALDPAQTDHCEASPDDYIEIGAGLDDAATLPVITDS